MGAMASMAARAVVAPRVTTSRQEGSGDAAAAGEIGGSRHRTSQPCRTHPPLSLKSRHWRGVILLAVILLSPESLSCVRLAGGKRTSHYHRHRADAHDRAHEPYLWRVAARHHHALPPAPENQRTISNGTHIVDLKHRGSLSGARLRGPAPPPHSATQHWHHGSTRRRLPLSVAGWLACGGVYVPTSVWEMGSPQREVAVATPTKWHIPFV